MAEKFKTFLVFGAPGSGKGTQGAILGAIPRFYHCACGDVFRSLDTRTDLGQEFVNYSSKGQLVPDDLTVRLWKAQIDSRVEGHHFKPDIDFLVLDGIPRNLEQAKLMDQHIDVLQLFHLSCPNREELARRLRKRALKDNRLDDASDEVIAKRIETYEEETKAILSFYPAELVTDIDASTTPAEVLQHIINAVVHLPEWKKRKKILV